jgi:3-carboxy-cis,cis-muconate cycloisomerase
MPHKQNPVSSAAALAASLRAPGLVATLLAAMPQEHERGLGGWQAEWTALPDLLRVTAGAARAIGDALEHLVVDVDRMQRNLEQFGGPAQAEAIVVALAPSLGRTAARATVERALARAATEGQSFGAALAADTDVTRVLDAAALAQRLAPARYLGQAGAFVDRVLGSRRGEGDA